MDDRDSDLYGVAFFAALLFVSARGAGAAEAAGAVAAGGPPYVTDAVPEPEPVGLLLIPGAG